MKHTYSEEELKQVRSAAYDIWQEIGSEAMALAYESGDNGMTRRDVIEMVSDAGRLEEELKRKKLEDLAKKIGEEDYKAMQVLLKPCFAARYS